MAGGTSQNQVAMRRRKIVEFNSVRLFFSVSNRAFTPKLLPNFIQQDNYSQLLTNVVFDRQMKRHASIAKVGSNSVANRGNSIRAGHAHSGSNINHFPL